MRVPPLVEDLETNGGRAFEPSGNAAKHYSAVSPLWVLLGDGREAIDIVLP